MLYRLLGMSENALGSAEPDLRGVIPRIRPGSLTTLPPPRPLLTPGSDEFLSGAADAVLGPYEPVQGLVNGVAAGDHTLTLQFVDTSTGFVNAIAGSATVSGVALGG